MVAVSVRKGPRPETFPGPPQSQVSQLTDPETRRRLSLTMAERMLRLDGIKGGLSRRAPPGAIGFFLDPEQCCADVDSFLLGNEIAHVHLEDDGSLHAVLPEEVMQAAIEARWAEPHPMAGMPTVSPRTVLIYAPRDEGEIETIMSLLQYAYDAARRD
ncbi:MAG: DUF5519 family protein [Altererythrobacter sp.]